MDVISVFNFIDIILVGILCILSFQLLHKFDNCGGAKPWWFAILPYVFVYSFISRILIFFGSVEVISPGYNDIVIAAYTVFYIGMIAFMYGMNIICSRIDQGKKG